MRRVRREYDYAVLEIGNGEQLMVDVTSPVLLRNIDAEILRLSKGVCAGIVSKYATGHPCQPNQHNTNRRLPMMHIDAIEKRKWTCQLLHLKPHLMWNGTNKGAYILRCQTHPWYACSDHASAGNPPWPRIRVPSVLKLAWTMQAPEATRSRCSPRQPRVGSELPFVLRHPVYNSLGCTPPSPCIAVNDIPLHIFADSIQQARRPHLDCTLVHRVHAALDCGVRYILLPSTSWRALQHRQHGADRVLQLW